jgi:hypothetical protein
MTGIVPIDFKLANIIPVYKTGSHTYLGNYRSISLLSIFSKILEKLMYNRLLNFLDRNDIFFEKQFGFRWYILYVTPYYSVSSCSRYSSPE